MNTVASKDGTQIYFKDWGKGQPVVFSHGWPLSADDWDMQMLFFLNHGYRVIAHDRRGHGRSSQTGGGQDMDHYADDLAALTAHLDLKGAVHVGHSTGGGEVVHYLARHGESRVAKAVIISAVPPLMVKTPANPGGLPKEVFDGLQHLRRRRLLRCDFSSRTRSGALPYGASRRGASHGDCGFARMATRLGEKGTLRRVDEVASTTGRGVRSRGGIRLHDGSSRATNRAEAAGRAEEGCALSAEGRRPERRSASLRGAAD